MQKAMKKKWIKALRSDEYEQGRGSLVSYNNEFCCLGVLCNISDLGEWKRTAFGWRYEYNGSCSKYRLPSEVIAHFEILIHEEKALMNMNDGDRASFNQIADWIEENM